MKQLERKKYDISTECIQHRYNAIFYLTHRQMSWLIISVVVSAVGIFMAGYFLGQHKIFPIISHDAPSHALDIHSLDQNVPMHATQAYEPMHYYAQIMSFGTLRAAERFVERLQYKNIPVKILEKHSKTAQGQKIIWYQVVTDTFAHKQELYAVMKKIEKEAQINDMSIVAC